MTVEDVFEAAANNPDTRALTNADVRALLIEAENRALERAAEICERMENDTHLPREAHTAAFNLKVGINALRTPTNGGDHA